MSCVADSPALSAVKVELRWLGEKIRRISGTRALLAEAQSSADSAIHSVRDLSHLLRPSVMDDLGLVAALDSLVTDFRRRHHIAVEFLHQGHDRRLQAETERAAYRIAQEALTNIARHGEATTGDVRLTTNPASLTHPAFSASVPLPAWRPSATPPRKPAPTRSGRSTSPCWIRAHRRCGCCTSRTCT